jgi:hypothetical protein
MGNRSSNEIVYGLKILLKWNKFELNILLQIYFATKDLLFFLLGSP